MQDWVLRCACDSWCGGLAFDEYLPYILSGRKKLPLFLGSSFSRKRKEMFSGDWTFLSDIRQQTSPWLISYSFVGIL